MIDRAEKKRHAASRAAVRVSTAIPRLVFVALLALWSWMGPPALSPAWAQLLNIDEDLPVALVADRVTVDRESNTVIAEGNVEVFYGERTLTAQKIIYNDDTGRIAAEGDIVLRDETGVTVFADAADLDADLKDGLVRGARAVMGEHTRLAAVEARRIDERYNTLSKAVYSPCAICPDTELPLWRIRARRIIHDEEERIIHYENATFDVMGVSIAWLPYFRHPDPTVKRASGFLVPSFLSSSTFGYAIKTPFFWVIDDHSDFTFTPFLTTDDGVILEGEYRKAFRNGDLRLAGSATFNDFTGSDRIQGHLDTEGLFALTEEINWGWDVTFTTDDAYLSRYDFQFGDRLNSEIFIERYRSDGFFDVSAVYFQSLRDDEPAGNIPLALPTVDIRYNLDDPWAGGTFGLFASGHALARNNGRNAARLTLGADWERQEVLDWGLALTGFGEVRADFFAAQDDPAITDDFTSRFTGQAGIEARFPLISDTRNGVTHVFEPVVQGIVAPYGGNNINIPVEDSLVTEFDETNVIDRNHFSGLDAFEEGPRINLSLRYERIASDGLEFNASVGRVYRFRQLNAFSAGSGLRDTESDFVASWQASFHPYVKLRHRVRFSEDATITRNEFFGSLKVDPAELSTSYVFLESDPAIGAISDREEINARGKVKIDNNWSVTAFGQRDLQFGEFVRIGGALVYENECCSVEVTVGRRFTDQENSPASTSFGLNISLLTLGDGNER
ncbi:MAG: LPS assembly protein LptD [Pseudomonadota bacterium]